MNEIEACEEEIIINRISGDVSINKIDKKKDLDNYLFKSLQLL